MTALPENADLVAVAEAIRTRRVSSLEVTQACIDRLAAVQPLLNCAVEIDAEGALEAARRADEELSRGEPTGPLLGVPLAHKDMFYRDGRVSGCGSRLCRDRRMEHTATVLARLDAAGALDLGRLHMSEFAFNPTGHNDVLGDCRNPWNRDHIPGGSSSGPAAAVASRAILGAMGSDTAGSIRIPAALCGLTGLKPTYGRVSRHGAMPLSFSLDYVGPLAQSARDCARILGVIAGADGMDGTASAQPVPDYESGLDRPLSGVRVGVPADFYCDETDPQVAAAVDASLDVFRQLGAEIRPVKVPDARPINLLTQIIARSEAAASHAKWIRERPRDYSEVIRQRIELGYALPAARYIEALSLRRRFLSELLTTSFSEVDVLHMPAVPIPAPTVAESAAGAPDAARFMRLLTRNMRPFNYTGLPTLIVPCGLTGAGLPVAMQLVGRPFAEARLLNLGHCYQRETRWHRAIPADLPRRSCNE